MATDALDTRRTAAAHIQSTFREVNRRIADLSRTWDITTHYVCECLDPECAQTFLVTEKEYESVRSNPARFFVLEGHEVAEIEATISRNDRFIVVEKLGAGAETAAKLERRYARAV